MVEHIIVNVKNKYILFLSIASILLLNLIETLF